MKTPQYDCWADLETENESDADSVQTPRRDSGRFSQRSRQQSGNRTPYYFDMPTLPSPMRKQIEISQTPSPSHTKSGIKKMSLNSSSTTSVASIPKSPLRMTLSRRVSECGKKNEWKATNVNLCNVMV